MSFVTCKLYAQAGNQFFMIATTIAHALKHGVEYKIPRGGHSPELPVMPWPHLPAWLPEDGLGAPYVEAEKFGIYHQIPYWPKMRLHGYWQSELYFKDYRKEILDAFAMPYQRLNGMVGVHVRRGDYLKHPTKHPVVTHDYLSQAIKVFTDKGYGNFWVFSDDILWCKEYFAQYTDLKIAYSEGRSNLDDMSLLSCCEHQIISNSTFSWVAAWINQNENKIVVTPSEFNWFGPDNKKHLSVKDVIPPDWIRITYPQ